MTEKDRTIVYVVKTITGEVFTSVPQPLYGVGLPIVGEYLKNGRPLIVETSEGPVTVNARHIVYVKELRGD